MDRATSTFNRHALLDALYEIRDELQLNPHDPTVPVVTTTIRFQDLFFGDNVGARDKMGEVRWKALKALESHSIIDSVQVIGGGHRRQNRVAFHADARTVESAIEALEAVEARNAKRGPGRLSSNIARAASQVLAFAAGVSLAVAIGHAWVYWITFSIVVIVWLGTLGVVPRWKGGLQVVGAVIGILGGLAAIAQLMWDIAHTK